MKKYDVPADLDYRYVIQKPAGNHKTFRVLKRFKEGGYETVKTESLAAINKAYRDKTFAPVEALAEVEQMIEGLYRQDGVRVRRTVSNQTNQNLLDQFFKDQYTHRDITDRDAAYNSFRRAVEALGDVSLSSATPIELAEKLRENHKGNAQRRRAAAIELILAHGGQHVKIPRDREVRYKPRHLTEADLDLVLSHIDDEIFALACRVAFATGCRIGELLGLKSDQYNEKTRTLYIDTQIDRKGDRTDTKNHKDRRAIVLQYGEDAIWEWFDRKDEFTDGHRLNAARKIKTACKKAFPKNSDKHCVFHDLRHSYVKFLLDHHVDIFRAARFIGDGVEVTEKYYAGWIVEESEAEFVKSLIDKPKRGKK